MFRLFELIIGAAIIIVAIPVLIILTMQKKKQQKQLQKELEQQEYDRTVIMDRISAADEDKTAFLWEKAGIRGKVTLTDMSGNGVVFTKKIDTSILIGKDESVCNVCLKNDRTVSKRHCEIIRRGNEFFITDKGSSNGTYLNDRQVRSNPAALADNDIIRMGRTQLKFRILE